MMEFSVPNAKQVLGAISDDVSLNIFTMIKSKRMNTEELKDEPDMSNKQCYDRIVKLIDTGMVTRKNGYYSITSFGNVVFQAQAKVSKAFQNQSKLEMIDAFKNVELPKDELTKLIDNIIDDDELRQMISRDNSN
jgi:predicted transcriptional regulator